MPNARIVLSSTTDTGHEIALAAVKAGEAELAIYFPLDLPLVLRRVLNALRPDAIGFCRNRTVAEFIGIGETARHRNFSVEWPCQR